jgi:hypothetical protein
MKCLQQNMKSKINKEGWHSMNASPENHSDTGLPTGSPAAQLMEGWWFYLGAL